MTEGSQSGSGVGTGPMPLTNRSRSWSRRPKNRQIWIRIRNTAKNNAILQKTLLNGRVHPLLQLNALKTVVLGILVSGSTVTTTIFCRPLMWGLLGWPIAPVHWICFSQASYQVQCHRVSMRQSFPDSRGQGGHSWRIPLACMLVRAQIASAWGCLLSSYFRSHAWAAIFDFLTRSAGPPSQAGSPALGQWEPLFYVARGIEEWNAGMEEVSFLISECLGCWEKWLFHPG